MKKGLEGSHFPKVYGAAFANDVAANEGARAPSVDAPVETWSWSPHDPSAATLESGSRDYASALETNYRPSHERQHIVLVFACGFSTEGLLACIEAADLGYFFVDFDEFTARGSLDVRADLDTAWLRFGEAVLDLRDVAAVLWNPPVHMFAEPTPEPNTFLYIHRWRQLLRDLRGLLREDALWMPSHPLNGSQEWQNKLSELTLAKRVGLAVPETLCTNDPELAHAFIEASPSGKILFREYSRAAPLFPLVLLDPKPTLAELATVRGAPCVFQRYVEKEFEVRAVLVGDQVFACRIDSQASERAAVDWRVYDNARVRWDRMTLPEYVQSALLKIGKALDLTLGSFDLIKSTDGRYYFLEVNRPGATYWLLPFVGLDVAKETVAYVARRMEMLQASSST